MCIVVEHRPNTMVMVSGAKGTKGAVYVIVCRFVLMVASLVSGVQTIQVSALSDEWYEGVYMNQSHSFSFRVFFFQGETEQEAQSYFSISVPFCPELNTPFEHRPGLLGASICDCRAIPYARKHLVNGHPGKGMGVLKRVRCQGGRGIGKVDQIRLT